MKKKTDKVSREKAVNESSTDDRIRKWQWAAFGLILVLGMLLRVGYIHGLRNEPDFAAPRGDMVVHDYWARALVTGQWTKPATDDNPHLDQIPFLRPPGYPYFLAIVYKFAGMNYLAPRVVQALLGLFSCAFVFFWGRRLIDSATGLIWSAFMAVFWLFIYFEGELNAPVVIILLFLLLFGSLWRWRRSMRPLWLCLAGLILGVATLFSPNLLGIIPAVLLWCLWIMKRRRALKRSWIWAVIFLLITAATIAPATIRNYRVSGEWILISCNGAITFYAGNNERSNGISSRIPNLPELAGIQDWGWFQYPKLVEGVRRQQGRDMTYSEVSAYFNQKAWDYIREHPGQTLTRMLNKAWLFWGPVEIPSNKEIQTEKYKTPILRYCPGFSFFLATGIIGLAIMIFKRLIQRKKLDARHPDDKDNRWEIAVLMAVFVLLYFLSYLPFVVSSRFRTPIVPFVLLASAFSWRCFGGYLIKRDWQSMLLWVIMVLCAFSLVAIPAAGYTASSAPWHVMRAEAYHTEGKLTDALNEFQAAIKQEPANQRAWKGIAFTLSQMGRFSEAVAPAEKAIDLGCRSADLYCVYGLALIKSGQTAQGVRALDESLRINPNYVDAYCNLGVYYAQQSDFSRTVELFEHARQLRPDDPRLLMFLAKALIATNQTDAALAHLNKSIALQPDDAEAHFLLASIYLHQNKPDLAKKELLRTLELKPDFPSARQRLNQLQNP